MKRLASVSCVHILVTGLPSSVSSLRLADNPWDTMIQMNSMTDEVVQKSDPNKPAKVDEEKLRKEKALKQ